MAENSIVALVRRGEFGLMRQPEQREELVLPAVDIYETPNSFVVKLDMPGSSKEDIRVVVQSDELFVEGAVKSLFLEREEKQTRKRVRLSYFRMFKLSEGLESSNAEAEFVDGVLTLEIPKRKEDKQRDIPIL